MKNLLTDKTAIVVGAGTFGKGVGNGKAAAIQFARDGAKVLCVDVNEAAAKETCDQIIAEGGIALTCAADVSKAADCQGVVELCIKHFGKLDILHNNVGIAKGGHILDMSSDDWDAVMNINARSMFLMSKYSIPKMMENKGGSIINVSSIWSLRPGPNVAYCASKGAVNSLTLYIARFYAKNNIRANGLIVGTIDTPQLAPLVQSKELMENSLKRIPLHRFGTPWELAKVASFLASDQSSFITGALINVDGGGSLYI